MIVAFLVLMAVAATAYAMTDYGCVNRCTQAGNMWGLCNDRCSW